MDMRDNKDYFETYLDEFPDSPSLVLVRSAEAKNLPILFLKQPILDLCCGDGFFSLTLGLRNISGCDISGSAIELARVKGIYNDLKVCDVRKLPYEDNSFNTILSNCALEHVEEVDVALLETSRVLTNGGHLIMTVPSQILLDDFPIKKLFESMGLKRWGNKFLHKYNEKQAHNNILSLEQWEKLLHKAGYKIQHHFYLFDDGSYKIAMVCDWLSTLYAFNIANRFFRFILPCWVRKTFWRKLLKKYYLSSMPLNEGGELVIVTKNEK